MKGACTKMMKQSKYEPLQTILALSMLEAFCFAAKAAKCTVKSSGDDTTKIRAQYR
jgi:hypothetical protein